MNDWIQFKAGQKLINVTDQLSKIIIHELGEKPGDFFLYDTKIRPQRTSFIKDKLALLGHDKFKYSIYANGLSPNLAHLNGGTFKNAELLYDLHWYVEGKSKYTTTSMPLAMECEWQQKRKGDRKTPFSAIKYDFQKLLFSNAEFRLMIFNVIRPFDDIIRPSDFNELTAYFEDNINNYNHLTSGSKFLFIAFYDEGKTFFYREIFKK